MERNIADIDCSKMYIHPNSPRLVTTLEQQIPRLKEIKYEWTPKKFTKLQLYKYVVLLYDPNSPIQKMHSLDWFGKKFEACAYAGYELSKSRDGYFRYDQSVLDMVMGKNDAANDVVVLYLAWAGNARWRHIVYLHETQLEYIRGSLSGNEDAIKNRKEARLVMEEIDKASNELAHTFDETEEFVSRFYYQIEQSRLAIRPEDYARAIINGETFRGDNPYGVNYSVEPLKFAGDTIPDEED